MLFSILADDVGLHGPGSVAAVALAVTAAGLFWKFALGRYQSAGE